LERTIGGKLQEVTLMDELGIWLMAFDFDRHLCLDEARKIGFTEAGTGTATGCWLETFDLYRAIGKVYVAA
jgi:hypothetical protein